jgi:TRAP-type mannitol/chloroaromatic compound transport system permease small subunit
MDDVVRGHITGLSGECFFLLPGLISWSFTQTHSMTPSIALGETDKVAQKDGEKIEELKPILFQLRREIGAD